MLGQQDDDDAVVVEIRLAAEGGRVDGVEVRIEQRADLVEVALRKRRPAPRRRDRSPRAGRRPWRWPCSGRSCRTSWWRRRRTCAASRPPAAPAATDAEMRARAAAAAGGCCRVRSAPAPAACRGTAAAGDGAWSKRGLAQARHRGRWRSGRPGAGTPAVVPVLAHGAVAPTGRRRGTPLLRRGRRKPDTGRLRGVEDRRTGPRPGSLAPPRNSRRCRQGSDRRCHMQAVSEHAGQQGPAGKGSGHVGKLRGGVMWGWNPQQDKEPQRLLTIARGSRYLLSVSETNWLAAVRFGADGLVPVVAQESRSGDVLMVAYANREALERTAATGPGALLQQVPRRALAQGRDLRPRADGPRDPARLRRRRGAVPGRADRARLPHRHPDLLLDRRSAPDGSTPTGEDPGGTSADPAGRHDRARGRRSGPTGSYTVAAARPRRARRSRRRWARRRSRSSSRRMRRSPSVSRPRRPISSIISWCCCRLAVSRWTPSGGSWRSAVGRPCPSSISTPTASTRCSTGPTGSPIWSRTSRSSAWTAWPSPTTATCTRPGRSTRRPRRQKIRPILGFEAYLAFGPRQAREKPTGAPAALQPPRPAGQEPGRLPEPDPADLDRVHRGVLPPAAHRQGSAWSSTARASSASPPASRARWRCTSGRAGTRRRSAAPSGSRGVFGPDGFWLEIQQHGIAEERLVTEGMLRLGQELGLGVVATNDAHYLRREDAEAHDVLLAIGTGSDLDDPKRFRFTGEESYVKSEKEMRALFPDHPGGAGQHADASPTSASSTSRSGTSCPAFPAPPEYATDEALLERPGHARAPRARYGTPLPPAVAGAARLRARASSTPRATPATSSSSRISSPRRASAGIPVGPGPRLGGRLARGVRARHHQRLPAQVRPAVRALPQSRARVDARHRRRLLLRAPGRGDRVRARALRPGERRPDRHLRDDEGARGGEGRGPRAPDPAGRGRPDHQADPVGPGVQPHDPRGGEEGRRAAGPGEGQPGLSAAGGPELADRGDLAPHVGARGRRGDRAGPAGGVRAGLHRAHQGRRRRRPTARSPSSPSTRWARSRRSACSRWTCSASRRSP